ncbi:MULTISPECIES: Stf0 family sulfotransferase [Rhodobacterales]|uniref:Stf0 family sulfotransferase n=1 Tax=Rhodobacterales TaxID=204455 RepID=UPI0015EFDC6E|nr:MULTISPECIES: Stf0 family sulfotransferase [Rhodobacterales]
MTISLPDHAYFLCTMPRSGSTLLCDLLTQTGIAGRPNSFFRPQSMGDFANDWGIPPQTIDGFDQSYIDTVRNRGAAETGCFGMRIMWANMPLLTARLSQLFRSTADDHALLQAAFGPLKFIHLARADKVAEAVSLDIAEQSGLWHRNADGTERERTAEAAEPIYDTARIQAAYDEVTDGQRAWNAWFTQQSITPLRVSYEALAAQPAPQLRRILSFVGVEPDKANNATAQTAVLSSKRNRLWAARFRKDAGLALPAPAP